MLAPPADPCGSIEPQLQWEGVLELGKSLIQGKSETRVVAPLPRKSQGGQGSHENFSLQGNLPGYSRLEGEKQGIRQNETL